MFPVVIERKLVRPSIVGLPGKVAALKEIIAAPIVAQNKDHITLPAFGRGEFPEINAADPILGLQLQRKLRAYQLKLGSTFEILLPEPKEHQARIVVTHTL